VDILVNNAGLVQFGATAETDERAFDASYGLNVKAPFFLTAALAPRMAARGWGRILNVTTMVAHFGMAGAALYGPSKGPSTSSRKRGRRSSARGV
jgi:NAD(P)-dependent dehydrogenase (short-subunit alcohol dehydrogenase family)